MKIVVTEVNQDFRGEGIIHEKIFLIAEDGKRPWVLAVNFMRHNEGPSQYLCMDYHKPCTNEEEDDFGACQYLEGARCNFGSASYILENIGILFGMVEITPNDFTPEFVLALLNKAVEETD